MSATRAEVQERLDALLTDLAHVLDRIPEGRPLPVSPEQVERLAVAYDVFSALRRHRYVAHRLGIELRPLGGW